MSYKNENYFNTSIGDLEYEVKQGKGSKYYFDKSNKQFFGSKIKRDDVFVNDKKTRYIFKEKLNNAPEGGSNVKVALFDKKKGVVERLYFGNNNAKANKILKENTSYVKKGSK